MYTPIKRKLSLEKFKQYVKDYNFGTKPPKFIVIHHTWKPTKENWDGINTIDGLDKYYRGKGWNGKGPHLFIAEDGIWLFTPMYDVGIHAGSGNGSIDDPHGYSIGIEVVGNYDDKVWSGKTKENALGVIVALQDELDIKIDKIKFHRDFSTKTCPGEAITKDWLFQEIQSLRYYPTFEVSELRRENSILLQENKNLSNKLQSIKDFIKNI